jgi:hypothetical protein
MGNIALADQLQLQSQEFQTGCFEIRSVQTGKIYLLAGKVVHAQTDNLPGLAAFFFIMSWKDAQIKWKADETASRLTLNDNAEALLVQFAQLEDSGEITEDSLFQLFTEDNAVVHEVKAVDLSNYDIEFAVVSDSWRGFGFLIEKEETIVGRADDCDVLLPDLSVSLRHCKILLERNNIYIADLGSTNGTYLNGQMIEKNEPLQVGDTFKVGNLEIKFNLKLKRKRTFNSSETPSLDTPAAKKAISWKTIDEKPKSESSIIRSIFKKDKE